MAPHFGPNVVGHEAHQKALREEAGGANVFGTRVRNAIPDSGPTNREKRQSEFGPAVVDGVNVTNDQATVPIEDLKNYLSENPTFFDSLYENELARAGGARPEALGIFYEVERGIKGAMREDVMAEIRGLLGQKGIDAEALAERARLHKENVDAAQERNRENALLDQAPRLKALREREENLKFVNEQGSESGKAQVLPLDQNAQIAQAARDQGVNIGVGEAQGVVGTEPAKPEGNIRPETQAPTGPILVPKGESTAEGVQAAQGTSPADGAGSQSTTEEQDFDTMTRAELEAYLGEDEVTKLKEKGGSGSEGAVVKDDLVKAAKRKQRREAK